MASVAHSVGKVSFHLKGVKTEKVFAQRQQISAYLQGSFSALLEDVLNTFAHNDQVLYIPQLKIQVHFPFEELNMLQFSGILKEELKKQLLTHSVHGTESADTTLPANHETQIKTSINSFHFWQAVWTFFLQHGCMPPGITNSVWQERDKYFTQLQKEKPEILHQYFSKELRNPLHLKRFLLNEHTNMQALVLETVFAGFAHLYQQLFHRAWTETSHEQRFQHLFMLFYSPVAELWKTQPTVDELAAEIKKVQLKILPAIMEIKEPLFPPADTVQKSTVFISNAGIVLLQPFISQLFSVLHLIDDTRNVMLQPEKACAVLSFLSGDKMPDETNFPLYKILCGLQPEALVNCNLLLEEKERQECFILLEHVIENWTVLRQISPESLQQTFLQRTGKLSNSNGRWLLQVEQKTEDVLLQFLPWSYSIIRYPWMPQPLFTEWA
ncbi:MAG TPA: contractile injection system tape measure protein [Lacibacter sp.]|nr:contractile injection system tape measure protein [Lacibacter sp.]